MMLRIHGVGWRESMGPGHHLRRQTMTWETPMAIDLRFGMEITMYISNR